MVCQSQTIDVQRDLGLYLQFMREIKERVSAIKRILHRIRPGTPLVSDGYVDVESCILQVRYICELIALAALAAHHQIGLSNDLCKEGHASRAFALLKRVNSNCFPRAIKMNRNDGGLQIELLKTELTALELKSIYTECGKLLHRGLLKEALTGEQRRYNVDAIQGWVIRIRNLLRQHIVMLLEPGHVFIITMKATDGEVEVLHAKAPGPSVLIE